MGVNVLQGSMFGISGRFPPLYAGAVMVGQAMGGVAPAVAAIALISFEVQPPILGKNLKSCTLWLIDHCGVHNKARFQYFKINHKGCVREVR